MNPPIYSMPIKTPEDYRPIVAKIGKLKFDLKSCVWHYLELSAQRGFTEDWDDYCIYVFRDISDMATSFTTCTLADIEEEMDVAREMMDFVFCAIGTKFGLGEA